MTNKGRVILNFVIGVMWIIGAIVSFKNSGGLMSILYIVLGIVFFINAFKLRKKE